MSPMRIKHETYSAVFEGIYVALMANLLLVLGCLPLVVGVIVTDPVRSWPLLALVAPLCAPGLAGVFAVLASFGELGKRSRVHISVLGTFGRVWRAAWWRAAALGALTSGALVVLGVDMRWAWGRPVGALVIPVLAVLMVLVVSTAMLALVVIVERPAVRLRDALRASLYLAVRRWYLTAASLMVLALLVTLLASRPAIALGLAASPLLYLVWANSRFSLRAALDPPASVVAQPA